VAYTWRRECRSLSFPENFRSFEGKRKKKKIEKISKNVALIIARLPYTERKEETE